MQRTANVLQHQYAIVKNHGDDEFALVTKGILICTGWYGWDQKNNLAFLCHFDIPRSVNSMPQILADFHRLVPKDHHFVSTLVGGKSWFWSKNTRERVKDMVRTQKKLSIEVLDGPYDDNLFASRNVVVSPAKGLILGDTVTGDTSPLGVFWIFGPMKKAKISD